MALPFPGDSAEENLWSVPVVIFQDLLSRTPASPIAGGRMGAGALAGSRVDPVLRTVRVRETFTEPMATQAGVCLQNLELPFCYYSRRKYWVVQASASFLGMPQLLHESSPEPRRSISTGLCLLVAHAALGRW